MSANAISSLAAGWRTTCGVFNDQLQCFGWNQYGQIGIGPDGDQYLPVAIEVSAEVSTRSLHEFDQLSLGVVHTCANTKGTKKLYCWGSNGSVNLLLKRPVSYYTPQPISFLMGGEGVLEDMDAEVLQISSGRSHNCAIVSYPFDVQKERFICWGSNEFGQLGIGSTEEYEIPKSINLLPQQISAGYSHQCAIQATDNSLWCWGLNQNGQAGVGTNTNVLTPTKISQLGAVSMVAAGSYHTCVITMMEATYDAREDENGRKEGNVYCFGSNSLGQLGIGNREDQQLPQKVTLGGMAKDIKAGRDHTCAIMEDSTMKCWGSNFSGQLGVGNDPNLSATPINVANLRHVEKLALGREHTCASRSDQTLWCWGTNSHGQLGLGDTIPNQYRPRQVNIQFRQNSNSPPPTESPTEPPSKTPVMVPNPTFEPTRAPSKQPTPPPTNAPTRRAIPIPTYSPVNALEPTANQPVVDSTTPPAAATNKPTWNRLMTFPTPAPSVDDVPTGGGQSIIIIVPTTETTVEEIDSEGFTIHSTRRHFLMAVTLPFLFSVFLESIFA